METNVTIMRRPQVESAMGLARSTIYKMVKLGLFTDPVPIYGRSVGWPLAEVNSINAARIAGKSDREIRDLVEKLHTARKELYTVEMVREVQS